MTPQLRYDEIPWEEFYLVLRDQAAGKLKKALIPDSRLRDIRLLARRNKHGNAFLDLDPKKNRDYFFFFLKEQDLVRQTFQQYVIFHTETDGAEELLRIIQRFRIDLKGKNFETFFQIDPRYGVVQGSSLEPVTRFTVKLRPGCIITLVFTRNPSHPMISMPESVDREDHEQYVRIFLKYNHVPPFKPSFLGKVFGHAPLLEKPSGWTYKFLADAAELLSSRYHFFIQTVSLVYEKVPESELDTCILDRKYSSEQTAGTMRFFTSAEELLQ